VAAGQSYSFICLHLLQLRCVAPSFDSPLVGASRLLGRPIVMTTPLQEHEIWHFENVISLETCSSLVMAISHAFEGKRLDEIPFEHVESKELLSALRNVESSVLDMVSKEFGRRAITSCSLLSLLHALEVVEHKHCVAKHELPMQTRSVF
jgi:hypothetical protein